MATKVYILSFASGKIYVGVSVDPRARLRQHLSQHRLLNPAAAKHGAPKLTVVFRGSSKECFEVEQMLVDELGSLAPCGYNLQRGGVGGSVPSADSRKRMSRSQRGRRHSEDTKDKMRVAHANRKPISDDTRAKLSRAGRSRDNAKSVTAMLAATTGRPHSEARRAAHSERMREWRAARKAGV